MSGDVWIGLIVGHVLGFWALVFYVFRLRRQVRCLHYCFIGISDWGIDRLDQATEYYIREHGHHNTPYILLNAHADWDQKSKYYINLTLDAGVRVPKDNHIHYVIEGLRG